MKRLEASFLAALITLSAIAPEVTAKTVKWAILGPIQPIHQELIKRYAAKNSGNPVELVSYNSSSDLLNLLIDEKPELLTLSTSQAVEYIDMSIFQELNSYYPGREAFFSNLMPAFSKNLSRKGKTYALPFWGQLTALNYNRSVFKAAGYPEPQPNWKYESDYYAAARKLTRDRDGNKKPELWGIAGGVHAEWLPVFYSWGAEFLSASGLKLLFTDNAAVNSLTFVQKLHTEGLAEARDPEEEFEPPKGPFIDGRSAMFMDSKPWNSTVVRSLSPTSKMDVGFTSTPAGPKGAVSVATSIALGIYKMSDNKKGAADFIKFLYDPETQLYMYREANVFPTRKDVFKLARADNRDKSSNDPMITSYEKAKVMGADEISQLILNNVEYGIYGMVHLKMTPAEIIKQAKDEFYKMLLHKDE